MADTTYFFSDPNTGVTGEGLQPTPGLNDLHALPARLDDQAALAAIAIAGIPDPEERRSAAVAYMSRLRTAGTGGSKLSVSEARGMFNEFWARVTHGLTVVGDEIKVVYEGLRDTLSQIGQGVSTTGGAIVRTISSPLTWIVLLGALVVFALYLARK